MTMQKKENAASIAELPKADAETADYHTTGTFHDHNQLYCLIIQSNEGIE